MNILKLYVYKGIDRELYFLVHKETWEKVFISCSQNGGQHIGSTISMSLFKKKNSVLLSLKTFAFLSLASLQLIRE